MKKPLNYCVVWKENNQNREEIIFSKATAVVRYVELMHLPYEGKNMISELSVLAIYKDGSKKDITSNINKFLYM